MTKRTKTVIDKDRNTYKQNTTTTKSDRLKKNKKINHNYLNIL